VSARWSHSEPFTRVRDAILALPDDKDRARLAGLFGSMTTRPHRKVGALRAILRAIAELDDDDLEKLAKWFSTWVNNWGQTPAATGFDLTPAERIAPPDPLRSIRGRGATRHKYRVCAQLALTRQPTPRRFIPMSLGL
jgi:hypothetical protein